MDEQRQKARGRGLERAALGERDQVAPARPCFGAVGPRLGVEQRQLNHPLGHAPHDLEGDVAAHREAAQREALGRLGQHRLGHRGDAVGAGQVHHPHLGAVGERRGLRPIQPLVEQQPRQQDQRRSAHAGRPSASPDQRQQRLEVGRAGHAQPFEQDHLGADHLDPTGAHAVEREAARLGRREATASATTIGRRPSRGRSSAVCSTQTWASIPHSTICGRPRSCSAAAIAGSALAAKWRLAINPPGRHQPRERGYGWPEPLRILLRREDRHGQPPRPSSKSRQRSTQAAPPSIAGSRRA